MATLTGRQTRLFMSGMSRATMSAFVAAILIGVLAIPAQAQTNPRQLGPFTLGQTRTQFVAAAKRAGLTRPRLQVPQERDLMGLGLMGLQAISADARLSAPEGGKLWRVTALLLGERVAYLSLDYGVEDERRAVKWHNRLDAPANVRKQLVDGAWSYGGIVFYADRFGVALHAVDWIGLKRSSRVAVSLDGAVNNANEFFRRLYARDADASVEIIRKQVLAWLERKDADGGFLCTPPPSTELTPGPSACDLPARRFPPVHKSWRHETWRALKIDPSRLSRYYSYSIESSGSFGTTRVIIRARGDLDCDGTAATLRVSIKAGASADTADCKATRGDWEVINPFD
ncbi:MAG: hypothetical protein ACI9WU_001856 [Myxococcota bacterium]|jgi:hypothetical protein